MKDRTRQEYHNLLEETVNYYKEDISRRAYIASEATCVYKALDGRMCAVGRCIEPDNFDYSFLNTSGLDEVECAYKDLDDIFQEQYKGFSFQFWSFLQSLHDREKNWTDKSTLEAEVKKIAEWIDRNIA
jgi:hypothetical protein